MIRIGSRVRVLSMDDPDAVPPGTCGTVTAVHLAYFGAPDQCWQVSVDWDNGSDLMLCSPPDEFEEMSSVE